MKTKKLKHFFSFGSCKDKDLIIVGTFENGVYKSDLISGSLEQEFYNRLSKKAEELQRFIYLMY